MILRLMNQMFMPSVVMHNGAIARMHVGLARGVRLHSAACTMICAAVIVQSRFTLRDSKSGREWD